MSLVNWAKELTGWNAVVSFKDDPTDPKKALIAMMALAPLMPMKAVRAAKLADDLLPGSQFQKTLYGPRDGNAFLYGDLKDWSSFGSSKGDVSGALAESSLNRLNLARQMTQERGGVYLKDYGDAFVSRFPDVTSAKGAAADIQALSANQADLPLFRMGISRNPQHAEVLQKLAEPGTFTFSGHRKSDLIFPRTRSAQEDAVYSHLYPNQAGLVRDRHTTSLRDFMDWQIGRQGGRLEEQAPAWAMREGLPFSHPAFRSNFLSPAEQLYLAKLGREAKRADNNIKLRPRPKIGFGA